MANPKVTVLMSVYNGEKYLHEAIDSILKQSFTNFEFLIIDDASSDSSPEILFIYHDPRIKIVRNVENLGLTKSLNKGLTLSQGELIARMDADDISLPNRLETQVQFLYHHPEFAVIGSSAQLIDENSNPIGIKRVKQNVKYQDLFSQNHFIHGSTMMRKWVLDEIGGYNKNIRYAQDYDLWLRITKNHKAGNIPDILYQLRFHEDAIKQQKSEESVLYHIFALKIARNELPDPVYIKIRNNICHMYEYLDEDDLYFLYGTRSEVYIQKNDLVSARRQYKNRFILKHRFLDLIDYILTFFGMKCMRTTKKFRRFLLNRFCKILYYLV